MILSSWFSLAEIFQNALFKGWTATTGQMYHRVLVILKDRGKTRQRLGKGDKWWYFWDKRCGIRPILEE